MGAFSKLEVLDVSGTQVDDALMTAINSMPRLQYLSLRKTAVTDAGLRKLKFEARLIALDLSETATTDKGLSGLDRARGLQAPLLENTGVGDATVKRLAKLAQLETLSLSETTISNESIADLAALSQLKHLEIARTLVDDGAAQFLAQIRGLTHLDLERTLMTRDGVGVLQALPSIEWLDLSGLRLAQGDARLTGFEQVRALRLAESNLPPEQLASMVQRGHLRRLDLSRLSVPAEVLQAVLRYQPSIRHLTLTSAKVNDAAIAGLSGYLALERLDLGNTPLTDVSMPIINSLIHLEALDLGLTKVTAAGLGALSLRSLHELNLASLPVSDRTLAALPRTLYKLGLHKTSVSPQAVNTLLLLSVQEVDLRKTVLSRQDVLPLIDRGVSVLVDSN
jgi:internalin A